MILDDYHQFGGKHGEFTAVRQVLAYQGIVNPHTNQPFSEAMLFGIGAGIGAAYFNFVYEGYDPTLALNVVGRYKAKYGEVMQRTGERLGLPSLLKTTKSSQTAENHLKKRLQAGQPVIIQGLGMIPFYPRQSYERFAEQTMVVYGIDETAATAYLATTAAVPLTLSLAELTAVRAEYGPLKNLSLTIASAPVDVVAGIEAGLHHTVQAMLQPPTPKGNFGLNALTKWADLVADFKSKRGWLQVFKPGFDLYNALATLFCQIELVAVDGGGMRGMYADFLDEASQIVNQPAWQTAAEQYRALAHRWTALAEAALPDDVPAFQQTKTWARQKQALCLAGAVEEAGRINEQQSELARAMRDSFPLSHAHSQTLLTTLRQHILEIHQAETAVITVLKESLAED